MKYRTFAALAALLTVGVVAGCGGSDESKSGGASSGTDRKPLRIALIPPAGGALGVFGKGAVQGWELAAAEVNANGGIDGHKVELKVFDTDGTPTATVRAARQAATKDDIHYIGAVITSPEHAALQPQLVAMNSISIGAIATDDPLTGAACSPNAFRVVPNNQMYMNLIAESLSKLPGERWAIQAMDYSTGHTAAKSFAAAAKEAGKQVVLTQFAPLNTGDFGSYITKLKDSDADALFAFVAGADAVAFINQGAQFKLFDKISTVVGYNMLSEPLFKALGDKIAGFYNNVSYVPDDQNPENDAFVKAYTQKFGSAPYYVPADHYVAARALFDAVRKAKSVEPDKVRDALEGLTFEGLDGPTQIRPQDHQTLRPAYLGQVVEHEGGLGWKTVAKAPATITTPEANPDCKLGS
jgi:branched-chain amino acid transport system substrate-binding protein